MNSNVVRIRVISIITIFFALILITKLYLVQVVSGDIFSGRADRQYIRPTNGVFDRGTIFFTSKDGSLMAAASLKTGFTVALNPELIKNPDDTYSKLSPYLNLDRDTFIAKATKKNDSYEEIAKQIDPDTANKIQNLALSGVNIFKDQWRSYPAGSLAAHVLGFVGYKSDGVTLAGRYGLENYYDQVLERNDQDVYVNFFAEIFSDIHKTFSDNGSIEGDIVSTIEPNVQSYLEKQLQIVQDTYQSKVTGGIVIDPKSGSIYAMAADPAFDPNSFQTEKNVSIFTNPLVQNVYEMGSIFKPLTMAAGLDAGVITSASTYNDTGCETLNASTICNYDLKSRGPGTSMQTVLNESLNLGAAYVESRLGNDLFTQYMYKYGINSLTGIDLPNEVKGLTDNLKSPRQIEHATASFGQGIAVTPIEMTRALAVLANGGYLITPHIVQRIDYRVGFSRTTPIEKGPQVIKPETSQQISKMLTEVVDDALLNGTVKLDHYSIASKTGTAQIAAPGGGYLSNQYLHSYFGYFPSYNPRFLVFLYTYEPQGVEYASHTLTMPFINIAKFLINYYEIPPDR